ncbi:F-box only protein 15 isoform X2 [Hemicordylus capensis]|uniref:F-box only protein 15 isoform X2 n=1 Tax=Hemicordylus capensis TaxID=884348 RepID=UPI002304D0E9|nr:F-box only protein 15 isoform X2 [Hemicordylus capensis]
MATGRGWILRQHSIGIGYLRPAEPASSSVGQAPSPPEPPQANPRSVLVGAPAWDSMPSEILLKIFSYLDALSLLCSGCVNKQFYQLSNDNSIWFKIYSKCFPPKRKLWKIESVQKPAVPLSLLELGFWKKEYIVKKIAAGKDDIIQLLKPINTYTGLPVKTKEAIKISGLKWVIILKDKNGKEHVMRHRDIFFNETSVTVFWYSIQWPSLASLSSLQLCGVTPVLLGEDDACFKNGPRRRSLISEYEMANLTKNWLIGHDALVELYRVDHELLVGLWKKSEIAFVMASLHYHQLIERSTLGSATTRYTAAPHKVILDDSDPEYGMHSYQLHIDMHSRGNTYMCSTFRSLFCRKDYIRNGYLRLKVISLKNNSQHLPLVEMAGFSWKTDALGGSVQNCFIMDVTVLDDSQKPFWCFSAPVNMELSSKRSTLYEYLGPSYFLKHTDSTGEVYVELVWMEETKEYYIVNLVLYLSTQKVNSWFGTDY